MDQRFTVHGGDTLKTLATLPDRYFDAVMYEVGARRAERIGWST